MWGNNIKKEWPMQHALINRWHLQALGLSAPENLRRQCEHASEFTHPRDKEAGVFFLQLPFVIGGWMLPKLTHLTCPKHMPTKRKPLGEEWEVLADGCSGSRGRWRRHDSICPRSRLFLHWALTAILSNTTGLQVMRSTHVDGHSLYRGLVYPA